MIIDELIETVKKQKECVGCINANRSCHCKLCKNHVSLEKRREMYDDILFHLNHEKWAQDKMEEMRVEEVD